MFTGLKNVVVRKTGDIGEILVRNKGNFLNEKVREIPQHFLGVLEDLIFTRTFKSICSC